LIRRGRNGTPDLDRHVVGGGTDVQSVLGDAEYVHWRETLMVRHAESQSIGAQMVTAATGAAFTGTVTVYVTGDAGTQAIGSVGSGICTHEGNGYHTYRPSQAETDYAVIAFTFLGAGAIPVTVEVATV
jgi:hypothetical protein